MKLADIKNGVRYFSGILSRPSAWGERGSAQQEQQDRLMLFLSAVGNAVFNRPLDCLEPSGAIPNEIKTIAKFVRTVDAQLSHSGGLQSRFERAQHILGYYYALQNPRSLHDYTVLNDLGVFSFHARKDRSTLSKGDAGWSYDAERLERILMEASFHRTQEWEQQEWEQQATQTTQSDSSTAELRKRLQDLSTSWHAPEEPAIEPPQSHMEERLRRSRALFDQKLFDDNQQRIDRYNQNILEHAAKRQQNSEALMNLMAPGAHLIKAPEADEPLKDQERDALEKALAASRETHVQEMNQRRYQEAVDSACATPERMDLQTLTSGVDYFTGLFLALDGKPLSSTPQQEQLLMLFMTVAGNALFNRPEDFLVSSGHIPEAVQTILKFMRTVPEYQARFIGGQALVGYYHSVQNPSGLYDYVKLKELGVFSPDARSDYSLLNEKHRFQESGWRYDADALEMGLRVAQTILIEKAKNAESPPQNPPPWNAFTITTNKMSQPVPMPVPQPIPMSESELLASAERLLEKMECMKQHPAESAEEEKQIKEVKEFKTVEQAAQEGSRERAAQRSSPYRRIVLSGGSTMLYSQRELDQLAAEKQRNEAIYVAQQRYLQRRQAEAARAMGPSITPVPRALGVPVPLPVVPVQERGPLFEPEPVSSAQQLRLVLKRRHESLEQQPIFASQPVVFMPLNTPSPQKTPSPKKPSRFYDMDGLFHDDSDSDIYDEPESEHAMQMPVSPCVLEPFSVPPSAAMEGLLPEAPVEPPPAAGRRTPPPPYSLVATPPPFQEDCPSTPTKRARKRPT